MITQPNIDWQWHDATKAAAAKLQADEDLRARRLGLPAQPGIDANGSHADVGVGTRPTRSRPDHFWNFFSNDDERFVRDRVLQDWSTVPRQVHNFGCYCEECMKRYGLDYSNPTLWPKAFDMDRPITDSWNAKRFDRYGQAAQFMKWASGVETSGAHRRQELGRSSNWLVGSKEVEKSGRWWSSNIFYIAGPAFVWGIAVGVWVCLALRALS